MPMMPTSSHHRPRTVSAIFERLAAQPTPAVVFYGHDGGRVELSGRVFENWVAKTANLLMDDLGLMTGDRTLVEPSMHWRNAVVMAAAWRIGATVELRTPDESQSSVGAGEPAALAVALVDSRNAPADSHDQVVGAGDRAVEAHDQTAVSPREAPDLPTPPRTAPPMAQNPAFQAQADDLMLLAYPALAMSLPQDQLPPGAIDFCAEVRAHGDHFSAVPAPAESQPALVAGPLLWTTGDLLTQATTHADQLGAHNSPVTAVHLDSSTWSPALLAGALGAWMTGTAVVITDRTPENVEHLLASEKVQLAWT
ncbi:TIGR03089 family protein [Kocuria sp.]|uniref:TIGR03089 family protein n=1 Tax=Kocuria sp. TaxID=1871328 RepID=UPI0026E1044A|nr:TIGR03089 family protein [Kocuria sp.]MDO5617502.1 TIGR03089 family protein [Kocuria sp.]